MTPAQTRILHVARRQLDLDEADYRLILRNVGGVESSTALTNDRFEKVMAFLEDRGFQSHPAGANYWRNKLAQRGSFATERAVAYIQELAGSTPYNLRGLCMRFSQGRAERPDKLNPREAWQLTEMLKKAAERKSEEVISQQSLVINKEPPAQPALFADAPALVGLPDAPAATSRKPREPRQRNPVPVEVCGDRMIDPTMDEPPF